MSWGLSDLLDQLVGTDVRNQFHHNLVSRGNTPSITEHYLLEVGGPKSYYTTGRLWVAEVDRILEEQTIGQFYEVAMGERPLPTGEIISQPLEPDEWSLVTSAYSTWAPPPFNSDEAIPTQSVMELLGSEEDADRMQVISKELQAMKARIWEGIMPLSARRWQAKQLYELANFSVACQLLSMAINVFVYLNHPIVKTALRDTFNLMDDVWRTFESVLNAKRAIEGKPAIEVSRKWHQFVHAKYAIMVNRTHDWVMNHVEQIKSRILDQVEATESGSEEERRLFDMWQDILEIASQADYTILLPMDGYHGSDGEAVDPEYDFRTQPLRVHPDINQRNAEYHKRRGHWTMANIFSQAVANAANASYASDSGSGDSSKNLLLVQHAAQQLTRTELRGEPVRYAKEPWTVMILDGEEWGFVAYRAHHSCSDAEWDEYRAKFDADNTDWGSELAGIESLRTRSKVHWLDARDFGLDGSDIEALKSSFRSFKETPDFPSGFASDIFLVADEASISSYLNPQPESSPPGDTGGFIYAMDVDFDPDKPPERADETPGYPGAFRVLGSLLWDDLSALVACRAQIMDTIWPLAMNHPSHTYVGPVLRVEDRPTPPEERLRT